MNKDNNSNIPCEFENVVKLFERRRKIIEYNNTCILQTTIFYENFFFYEIIKKIFFTEKFNNNKKMNKFIIERMNFSDRYEIIKEYAKEQNIKPVSNSDFEYFIKIRNLIAHNLSSVNSYNIETNETLILFGGKTITWNEYLEKIEKWSEISYKIAEFTKEVFHLINNNRCLIVFFGYCKLIEKCALFKCKIFLKEPEGNSNLIEDEIDLEILKYINEENNRKL